jgi:molecular chaperone DnaJ
MGGGGFQGGGFQDIFGGGGDPQDIFSTLFGGGRRGPSKGADLQTEATISFRDSIFGSEINLRLERETITTRVPAGVKDGSKIKLKGRGAPGQAGPGDLFVIIHVTKHPVFTRDEDNLLMTLPVTFAEAALGADIAVPTLDGEEVKVRLAPGTSNGKVLRVKGRGITRNHHTGDLLITIDVVVPQRVDGKAKKALEDFAAVMKDEDMSLRADLAQRARA